MADENEPKVLIIDDGTQNRVDKTDMYANGAEAFGGIVTRARLQDLDKEKLKGYNLILTDLDGKGAGSGVNSPDHDHFLSLLNQAVREGATPIVRMFSGYFEYGKDNINFSQFPDLQNIATTHIDNTAFGVIKQAMDAVKKPVAPSRADGQPWTAVAGRSDIAKA